ncbi:MAG: ATP-binding domain-containing protein, partial [Clostridia bacterium]|nr:ATP-binding domain-containing protein [Clostridia bacterium]
FCMMMQEFIEAANDPTVGLDELLDMVLEKSGYVDALIENDEKAQERIENLKELSSTLLRYQEDNGDEATLGGYLEDVALITDIDNYDTEADCAVLMTLHAAKGLEFPVVCIPGAEEGIFPGVMTMYDAEEVEEDRRLAYVGITRAKKKLHITHAAGRVMYGQTQRNKLSRYIEEIDKSLIERKGMARRATVDYDGGYGGGYGSGSGEGGYGGGGRASSHRAPDMPAHSISGGRASGGKSSFAAGDKVKHRIFGEGEVISASAMGNDTLLEINFAKVGTKKLMANFAGLKKL